MMEMRQLLVTAATLQWTCRTAAVWIILQQSDVLSLVSFNNVNQQQYFCMSCNALTLYHIDLSNNS